MSAMNAWVTYTEIAIATDTYCHIKKLGVESPKNFFSKVFQLPHCKSCFAWQGLRDLGLQFLEFIMKETNPKDVLTLTESAKRSFNIDSFYVDVSFNQIGTIFIFGLNDLTNNLEVYKLNFDENRNVVIEQLCKAIDTCLTIIKPGSSGLSKYMDVLNWSNLENATNSLSLTTQLQKQIDDIKGVDNAGIGGEIQLTVLKLKGENIIIETSIIHKFSDYDIKLSLM